MQPLVSQLMLAPVLAASSSMADSQPQDAQVDLEGCATEWDDDRKLRSLLRKTGSVFALLPDKESLESSVECASFNVTALLPVMKRLGLPDQTVGMITIPQIQSEFLA